MAEGKAEVKVRCVAAGKRGAGRCRTRCAGRWHTGRRRMAHNKYRRHMWVVVGMGKQAVKNPHVQPTAKNQPNHEPPRRHR